MVKANAVRARTWGVVFRAIPDTAKVKSNCRSNTSEASQPDEQREETRSEGAAAAAMPGEGRQRVGRRLSAFGDAAADEAVPVELIREVGRASDDDAGQPAVLGVDGGAGASGVGVRREREPVAAVSWIDERRVHVDLQRDAAGMARDEQPLRRELGQRDRLHVEGTVELEQSEVQARARAGRVGATLDDGFAPARRRLQLESALMGTPPDSNLHSTAGLLVDAVPGSEDQVSIDEHAGAGGAGDLPAERLLVTETRRLFQRPLGARPDQRHGARLHQPPKIGGFDLVRLQARVLAVDQGALRAPDLSREEEEDHWQS